MLDPSRLVWRNPATWYGLFGVVLLALTLWTPWATAARTTRVEERAQQLAVACAECLASLAPGNDAAAREHFLARWQALAAARGAFVGDLEPGAEPAQPSVLLFANKHYAFQVAPSPPPVREPGGPGTLPPLEVIAWPLAAVGPGHCVFFVPSNAPRAYSRNLTAGYAGWHRAPPPGCGHRRAGSANESNLAYRGEDDERWVPF
ncbi:MAG: hypothetical protein WAT39_12385 [Planctomycetota bacterium]